MGSIPARGTIYVARSLVGKTSDCGSEDRRFKPARAPQRKVRVMSYKRKQIEKHKLKKLYDETWHSYSAGAYYDDRKNRFIKYSCHNRWLRAHCRRISRRRMNKEGNLYSRGSYNRVYDYWRELI